MSNIHSTAVVSPQARVPADVQVGPYVIIKGAVTIGAGTVIHEHSVIHGVTRIGRQCQIGPAAYVGLAPQHLRADPNIGQLSIGDRVTIREGASVHRSTRAGEENATRIGNDCFLMGSIHVAHDCVLGNEVIMANGALLAGHCHVGNKVFLGGGATIHQNVRIGRLAIIGGNEACNKDIPPFCAVRTGGLRGYNAVGCRRSGISSRSIHIIRSAFRALERHRLLSHAFKAIADEGQHCAELDELIDFIKTSERGIIQRSPMHRRLFETVDGDE